MLKNERQRKWRKDNPEKVEKYKIKAREHDTLRRKTKHRQDYMKKFREDNKEKLKIYSIEYNSSKIGKEREKRYSKTNKGKIRWRNGNRKRRANKNNIIELFTQEEWNTKLKKTLGFCPKCKKFIGIDKLTLDHIFPISKAEKGRIYTINDIQPLCVSCNSIKKNNLILNLGRELV